MLIPDPNLTERLRKSIDIKNRVGARTRKAAYINEQFDISRLKHLNQLIKATGRMSNRIKCGGHGLSRYRVVALLHCRFKFYGCRLILHGLILKFSMVLLIQY